MCRLYGFRANEPTKVECTLVHSQNALLIQSQADLRGKAHPHGWGIACYANSRQRVERRETAAFEDIHFSVAAERVYSRTVIAHVRKATVGGASLANTHPFTHGYWTFAHNGTVVGFDGVSQRLMQQMDPRLRSARQGTTDSEMVFYWLLSLMAQAGVPAGRHVTDPEALQQLVGESVQRLGRWCQEAQPDRTPKLNFLLTDGRTMFATRWNNSLYWVRRQGLHDCEICGIPHVHHDAGRDYLAVVVASEPLSHEEWDEVPNHSVLQISENLHWQLQPLQAD